MATTAFNTRKAVKTLKDAGVTAKAASAHVEVLEEITDNLVTKDHFELRLELLRKDLVNTLTLRMCVVGGFIIGMVKYLP